MIITKKYAKKLIREGKAEEVCVVWHDGERYMTVTRYDVQRDDHYKMEAGE